MIPCSPFHFLNFNMFEFIFKMEIKQEINMRNFSIFVSLQCSSKITS